MYSHDISAAEIHARQDHFYQQGRIDQQARELRAGQRRQHLEAGGHLRLTAVVRALGAIRPRVLRPTHTARLR